MGTAAIVSCESQKEVLHRSNVRRVTGDGNVDDLPEVTGSGKGEAASSRERKSSGLGSAERHQQNGSAGRCDLDWSMVILPKPLNAGLACPRDDEKEHEKRQRNKEKLTMTSLTNEILEMVPSTKESGAVSLVLSNVAESAGGN